MGKDGTLVPITREFLHAFYCQFPLEPVPDTVHEHMARVEALSDAIQKAGSKVPEQVGMPTPTRIDDCFWRNRMFCEETAVSLDKVAASTSSLPIQQTCIACKSQLLETAASVLAVQDSNTAAVKQQMSQFIPQDFRGQILERANKAKEARYKKLVEDLVKKGGSVRQKYDMCLQHQWERRQSIVELGECSGVYKLLIKYLAGIPQVLLDFAKQINAKLGPMEEQRLKYGPDLYAITTLGIQLDVCMALWAENAAGAEQHAQKLLSVVQPAVQFYTQHLTRIIQFIGYVFARSPFFVKKSDLGSECCESGRNSVTEGSVAASTDICCYMDNLTACSTVPHTQPASLEATSKSRFAAANLGPSDSAHSAYCIPAMPRLSCGANSFCSAEENQPWQDDLDDGLLDSCNGCLKLGASPPGRYHPPRLSVKAQTE